MTHAVQSPCVLKLVASPFCCDRLCLLAEILLQLVGYRRSRKKSAIKIKGDNNLFIRHAECLVALVPRSTLEYVEWKVGDVNSPWGSNQQITPTSFFPLLSPLYLFPSPNITTHGDKLKQLRSLPRVSLQLHRGKIRGKANEGLQTPSSKIQTNHYK